MRIAVTYDYDKKEIFQHFGHSEYFKFYDVNDGQITSMQIVSTDGQGHAALAEALSFYQVDLLICGGIGDGAYNALEELGINVLAGVSGDADVAVTTFINGSLTYTDKPNCTHHHEHGDHDCHSGGCGHSCSSCQH